MSKLEELRNRLTEEQAALLSEIWNYYCERDRWIARRILHQRFKNLRKQGVRVALEQLGGSIVREARDQGEEVYQVTLVGALLTDRGRELEDHVVRFLEYFRDRFDEDPEISQLGGEEVQAKLDLTPDQAGRLFQAVWISALCGNGGKGRDLRDLRVWRFGLPYDIEDIPANVQAFFEGRISKEYDPAMPFADGERQTYFLRRNADSPLGGYTTGVAPGEAAPGVVGRQTGNPPEDQLRRLRAHRGSLLALRRHLRELLSAGATLVPLGQFTVLAHQVEDINREFPGLAPRYEAAAFFSEKLPSGDHYNSSTMLSYVESCLARIDAELPAAPLTLEDLHPEILTAAGPLFMDRHYASAIFEAFKTVEVRVRKQSGLDASGRGLMALVFDEKRPLISVTNIPGRSGQDEQEGFKLIFMGAMQGIRNPKGHEPIELANPQEALEYLALASLLMRRLDDGGAAGQRTAE